MEFKFETQLVHSIKVDVGVSSVKPDARMIAIEGSGDKIELTVSGYELFSLGVAIMEHFKETVGENTVAEMVECANH